MVRAAVAEGVGAAVLVLVAVGSAVAGFRDIGPAGVALAFGLVYLALRQALGAISGGHLDPAVTLGALLARRLDPATAGLYVLAQTLGGLAGALGLLALTTAGGVADQTGTLGANSWGAAVSGPGAFGLEVVLTAVFVLVLLRTTPARGGPGPSALAGGATLAAVHLVGIPLDATSVNPARSIGPALLAGGGALAQLWLFVVAPLLGGVLATGLHRLLGPPPEPVVE